MTAIGTGTQLIGPSGTVVEDNRTDMKRPQQSCSYHITGNDGSHSIRASGDTIDSIGLTDPLNDALEQTLLFDSGIFVVFRLFPSVPYGYPFKTPPRMDRNDLRFKVRLDVGTM